MSLYTFQDKDWFDLFYKFPDSTTVQIDGRQEQSNPMYASDVVYFIDRYGNVKQFSCQDLQLICVRQCIFVGVEKNNDEAKKIHFHGSNKWDATADIIASKYSLSLISKQIRKKRDYRYVASQLIVCNLFLLPNLRLQKEE